MPSYTVKKGDTLSKIAREQGYSLSDFKLANQGIDFNKLKIGQKINIPHDVIDTRQAKPADNMYQTGDIYLLSALAATESLSPQGQADVAQSIYNRAASKGYPNKIRDIILQRNQYQPVFSDPNKVQSDTADVWKNVKDEQSAIKALQYYYSQKGENISTKEAKSKLYSAVENVTNPMFQKEAKTFVGSNTEFLAPTFNPEGSIHRGSSLDNKFFTRYTDNPQTGLIPEQLRIYSNQPDEPMVGYDEIDYGREAYRY